MSPDLIKKHGGELEKTPALQSVGTKELLENEEPEAEVHHCRLQNLECLVVH